MSLSRVFSNRTACWFIGGCFLSSLGSVTYLITLLAMSSKLGMPIWILGITLGAHRVVGFLANATFGHMSDLRNPRAILLFTELGGALGSVFLALTASQIQGGLYWPFIIANVVRSGFMSLQASAVGKTTKILDEQLGARGRFSILVNKSNFGTIFFGMFLSIYFVSTGSFQLAIIFDFCTFLLNGLVAAFFLPTGKTQATEVGPSGPVVSNLVFYFKSFPALYSSDFVLALVMFGANTLNARLYLSCPHLIPVAAGAFGLSVWLAGPVDRYIKISNSGLWVWLAVALVAQGCFTDSPAWLLLASLLRNVPYWILYNRITVELTKAAPVSTFGKLTASRQATTILVGSLGEWWVGMTSSIPVMLEMFWRGLLAAIFSLRSVYSCRKQVTVLIVTFTLMGTGAKADMSDAISMPLVSGGKVELDPQLMENVASVFINLQIHRGLMRFTPDLQITGSLAEKYEVLDAGKRFRFHLHETAFSDGAKLQARDVVTTFRKMFISKSGMSADIDYIEGARLLMEGKSVEAKRFGVVAVSDTVVDFKLSIANPLFLMHMAAVDSAIYKLDNGVVIGAGPYRVSSNSSEGIILGWNLGFHRARGKAPGQVRFIKIKDESEAIFLARQGAIDSLDSFSVSKTDMAKLISAGWHQEVTHLARSIFLSLGPSLPVEARRVIQAKIYSEYKPPASFAYRKAFGMIPDVLPGALTSEHAPEKSRAKTKLPKVLKLSYLQGSTELADTARTIKNILDENGIAVQLQTVSADEYFATLKNNDYDLVLRSKYLDYPDALSILTYFDSRLTSNTFGIRSSGVDQMLEKAKHLPNGPEKFELYRDIQITALKMATLVPIAFGSNASGLWSKRITRVPEHPMGIHSLPIDSLQIQ